SSILPAKLGSACRTKDRINRYSDSPCCTRNWRTIVVESTDFYSRILIDAGNGPPVIVQMVLVSNSDAFVPRLGHGLQLMFHDVVGEKVAAVSNVPRGRDFYDLARILNTPGWTMKSAEDAMCRVGFFDRVSDLGIKVDLFRQGHYDDEIRRSGFDVTFCHHVLDHD
ncbi:nucleotidyl transferase AbiEii/AbiGii toxin family protein, partial [Rhodococcoides yunnanense]|uniref:nucleotidyl transferase AbiEii/AbiGii toxin family protein n=1 Tax=Rhodococcoides yunnanense TaxID=278209 RepID=UPI0022B1E564